jgi:outer membrane protein
MQRLSFVGCFMVAALFLMNCQKSQPATVMTNPSQAMGGKIVYVNLDTLLEKYDLYKDNRKQLEEESKKAESSLAARYEGFQKRAADFQRQVMEIQQRAQDIAPKDLQAKEAEFGEKQRKLGEEEQAIMKQRENSAVELDKKIIELQKNLKNKIDAYLEKISAERGYDYVLIKGNGGGVLFGNKALDITNETIVAINEAYKTEKK